MGWWEGMRMSDYFGEGGIYANVNTFTFKQPYLRALESVVGGKRFLWGTQPVKGCKNPDKIDFRFMPDSVTTYPDPIRAALRWVCLHGGGETTSDPQRSRCRRR